jgi:hypothetical protein
MPAPQPDRPAVTLQAAATRLRDHIARDQVAILNPAAMEYLALWLDTTAAGIDLVDYCGTHGDDHPCRCIAEPLALAEAVLAQTVTQAPRPCSAPHPDNSYCGLDRDHDLPHEAADDTWTGFDGPTTPA